MAATKKLAPKIPICAAILRLKPSVLDEEAIRALVQGSAANQADVAIACGRSPATIRSGWIPEGMPGKRGAYPLADVLIWRLSRDLAQQEKQAASSGGASELNKRQSMADIQKTELHVRKLEIDVEEREGRLVDRNVVGTALRAVLSSFAEKASTVGEQLEPLVPIGSPVPSEANRIITRLLTAASETAAREVAKYCAKQT